MALVSPGRKVNQQGEREGKTEQNVMLIFPSRDKKINVVIPKKTEICWSLVIA